MKKRSIALALCCSLVASPVWAKTFVGVLYPFLGPMAAIGLVELAGELKAIPDVEVATYLHQSWKALVDDINRQPKGTHILIVGYSLGANNAILVANNTSYVDSIVALQPSMLTSQESLTGKDTAIPARTGLSLTPPTMGMLPLLASNSGLITSPPTASRRAGF